MSTNVDWTGQSEDRGQGEVWHSADELLKDDGDWRVLRLWRESLVVQDPRYNSKILLKLVALAMADEQFRSRLINDTEGVLRDLHVNSDLPEGVTLRFLENTQNTLNVVLPPRAGELSNRATALREALRSRTSSTMALFKDDFDIGNFDSFDLFGDPEERDPPIFQ